MTLVGEEGEVLDALQWGLAAEVSNSFCEAFSNSFLDIFINCINMYLYQYCPYPLPWDRLTSVRLCVPVWVPE